MQAIVFADRLGREFGPLTEGLCPALLPVAGKPLLEYALEDLADAAIEEVIVVVSANSQQIQERFGDGARWGFVLSYALSRGEEAPAALIARLGSRLHTPFLALRGDTLRTPVCREFTEAAAWLQDAEINALVDGRPAGVCLVNAMGGSARDVAWPTPPVRNPGAPRIGMGAASYAAIESVAALHAANMDVLNGRFPGLALPGREPAGGLRVGRLSTVDAGQIAAGPALIGDDCVIRPSARLRGNVVVGDGCYVDADATLRSAVVLPGTYVGQNVNVSDAVVRGDVLVRVDTGTTLRVTDGELLAPMDPPRLAHPLDRLAGLGLLGLSLPLWPIALLLSLVTAPRRPLVRLTLRGNRPGRDHAGRPVRLPVETFAWACPAPLLRHLPRLLAVVSGDLRLFGTPVSAADAECPPATHDGRDAAADYGLLDASLFLPADAPEEEIALTALVLASERGLATRLRRALQAAGVAFSTRAWLPRPAA